MMGKLWCIVLLLALAGVTTRAAGSEESERLYRQSLDSYLLGQYDQAIVLAAQSLQLDPAESKAQDLLTVLVAEKERVRKSEVWISVPASDVPPSPAPSPETIAYDDSKVWEELSALREDVRRLRESKRQESAQHLMTLFEQRVQVIAGLLDKSSTAKVAEVRQEQERMSKRMGRMTAGGVVLAGVLGVLSLVSMVLSIIAFRRHGQGRAHR